MADNYYDATGVLVLKKVTPVITALFGGFNLDESYPGDGQAYLAKISDSNNPSWDDVLEGLVGLSADLKLVLPEDAEETVEEYLFLFASHFGADGNHELGNLIEHYDFTDDAELAALFDIAMCFDDGHGLTALKFEGCWHCSKPQLFAFGGHGEYYGRNIFVCDSSSSVLALGEELDEALAAGNLDQGADSLLKKINSILAGVSDAEARNALHTKLGDRLAVVNSSATDRNLLGSLFSYLTRNYSDDLWDDSTKEMLQEIAARLAEPPLVFAVEE